MHFSPVVLLRLKLLCRLLKFWTPELKSYRKALKGGWLLYRSSQGSTSNFRQNCLLLKFREKLLLCKKFSCFNNLWIEFHSRRKSFPSILKLFHHRNFNENEKTRKSNIPRQKPPLKPLSCRHNTHRNMRFSMLLTYLENELNFSGKSSFLVSLDDEIWWNENAFANNVFSAIHTTTGLKLKFFSFFFLWEFV